MSDTSHRPPGRPRGGRIVERDDIVDAALAAISAGGYPGLSMRGVARKVGVSLATVQRHFPTKMDLWKGAISSFFASVTPDLSLERPDVPQAIEHLLEQGHRRPGLIATLLSDQAPGHEERLEFAAQILASRRQRITELAAERKLSGEFGEVDPTALVLLITLGIGSISGATTALRLVHGIDLEDAEDRSWLANALADILRYGFLPR